MSARPSVEQRAQYGQEVTPGSAVDALRRFTSGNLTFTPNRDTDKIRPSGEYFDTIVYEKSNTSTGSFAGTPAFGSDLVDILTLAFGAPDTVAADAAGVAFTYTWNGLKPQRNTWTVETGDATDGSRVTGAFAKSIEFTWGSNSGDSTLNMDLLADAITDGITLTAGSVMSPAEAIIAKNVRIYVDDSAENLGATPMPGALSYTSKIDSIADIAKYFGSYDTVNTAPDATIEIKAEESQAARDLSSTDIKYVRAEASGSLIPGATDPAACQKLTLDNAVRGEGNPETGDESNVFARTSTLRFVKDSNDFDLRVSLVTDVAPAGWVAPADPAA